MPTVLITGASSGIGYATAQELVRCGYRVFGTVRKLEDADRLQQDLGPNFTPLMLDVTDALAVQRAADQVASLLQSQNLNGLDGLINNAGIATSGPLAYQPIDEIRWQFEVNVIAPVAVIQAFLPLLKQRATSQARSARIINISSVGGKIAAPFLGAYAGSKHAIEGLSQSLRRELKHHNIDVVIVGPGAVKTPIWQKESTNELSRYADTEYDRPLAAFQQYAMTTAQSGYEPDVIGRAIRRILETKHPKTRYAIVPQAIANWVIPRLLPDRWLDRLFRQYFGL